MNSVNKRGVTTKTLQFVKKTIDDIYSLTVAEPFHGGFAKESTRFRAIVTILVKRGILIKEHPSLGHCSYRWFDHLTTPTKVLYESVAQELRDIERKYSERHLEKKRKSKDSPAQEEKTVEEPTTVPIEVEPKPAIQPNSLHLYTIEQLWAEIKSRGCVIVDNKLAFPVVQYQFFL